MSKGSGNESASIKPDWLKIRITSEANYSKVGNIIRQNGLNTICSSGMCPNRAECWNRATATLLILGDVCTRGCRFCATNTGRPTPIEKTEPQRVANSVKLMGLEYVVLTSVTRDDLPDRGADQWRRVIEAVKKTNPTTKIEVLIPDFDANPALIDLVLSGGADVVGHNIETIERLTPKLRGGADYRRSLKTLRHISEGGAVAKSGLMVGLGEREQEVALALEELRGVGCRVVTIGQYLQPTREHWAVAEYVRPEQFEKYKQIATRIGFDYVASAPLVRSSYRAEQALTKLRDVVG